MTSFIAACGSGRSTSFIPAVPAAWSVTTIAFMIIFSSVICLFGGNVASMGACRSGTSADDHLPPASLGPVEGGDGIVERRLTVGGASGADDVGAGLARELGYHRTDCAGRAVSEDALPRPETAVLEQSLPGGQARHRHARTHREVDVARQWREVACLDGHILGQGAVASPVREAEHPLSDRQPRRAIAECGDNSGQLVPGDRRCSVTAEAIGPGRGPRQLSPDESRRMNLNDDVVYRCLRLGPLHQLHPGRSRSLIRHHYRLHRPPPRVWYVVIFHARSMSARG